jgi:hypothetical protein
MLKRSLALTIILFLYHVSFSQENLKGFWLLCDSSYDCSQESVYGIMVFEDSTITSFAVMEAGLDPIPLLESHYVIENSKITITDINSAGKVIKNMSEMIWIDQNTLQLVNKETSEISYLFRQE